MSFCAESAISDSSTREARLCRRIVEEVGVPSGSIRVLSGASNGGLEVHGQRRNAPVVYVLRKLPCGVGEETAEERDLTFLARSAHMRRSRVGGVCCRRVGLRRIGDRG